jgi:hypothetical protein
MNDKDEGLPDAASITTSKVPLEKSENFFKGFASDVAVSGPTPDGQVHIAFINDRVNIISQTLEQFERDGNTYARSSYHDDDTKYHKEYLGTCSLTASASFNLIASMIDRAIANGQKSQLQTMLTTKGLLDKGEEDV